MANLDRPKGFEPYGKLLHLGEYTAGALINPGELVAKSADGMIDPAAESAASLGVAMGYATSGNKVVVADDPNQEFVVQADTSQINVQTDIGLNYILVATGDNTTYKIARMELDADTGSTSATRALKVQRIEPAVNNALGAQVDVVVRINNHQLAGGTGTVGV